VTHGFSGLWGSGCNESFVISYHEGSGTTWSLEATPYRGFVVATAWDTTGSYLLYMDRALKLRITKRLTSGTYIQGRLLSTNLGPDGSLAQGDVVATGGRWWAVWREHVGPGHGRVQQLLARRADVGDDDLCHLEPGRPHGAGQQRQRDVPEPHLRDAGRSEPPAADRGHARSRGGRLDLHRVVSVRGRRDLSPPSRAGRWAKRS
jgi:hypothetical protein